MQYQQNRFKERPGLYHELSYVARLVLISLSALVFDFFQNFISGGFIV